MRSNGAAELLAERTIRAWLRAGGGAAGALGIGLALAGAVAVGRVTFNRGSDLVELVLEHGGRRAAAIAQLEPAIRDLVAARVATRAEVVAVLLGELDALEGRR